MTNYQESFDKMSLASLSFLLANAAITNTIPGINSYIGVVQTTHAQIQPIKVQQEANKKKNVAPKKQQRALLIAQAMDVQRRIYAYATNVANTSLLNQIGYTESTLKRFSDPKLVSSCQLICDTANTNLAALANYGVTAAMLATLQTSVTNFNNAVTKETADAASSSKNTDQLAHLFKILVENWAKIDILIEMVRNSQPNYYNEYQRVRKIIIRGRRSLPLKVKITRASTGEPEAHVVVTLVPADEQLKAAPANGKNTVVKKTGAGGGCYFKNLSDGTYTITAKKSGLKDVTKTIYIVNGEMLFLEMAMEEE